MSDVEAAVTCFKEGFSCSQATLVTYGPKQGFDRETAIKIASTFGGGMGMSGETCGAVTGALMALGLKHDMTDPEAKANSLQRAKQFLDKFQGCNGSTICWNLRGCDLSTLEGKAYMKENKLNETICPKLVWSATEIMEQML
ncbi:MAG TPA: C-GCAxxG-C-C family protein [Methylomusa anaerophila]|uniref:Redox-active protein n=1 Tax=Methylomusa anaerophila TaxID=1930071 RepID=A0A348AG59_9FIRM|nr:C-GCAxxG-C-C family protein [Methylomusa anaerophila]BBB90057.1 Putative redox-active protein [Methylomusa anaerophila]HML88216.1 C-GCAxxG-C-C family protein [Methylomusa anaerophila]